MPDVLRNLPARLASAPADVLALAEEWPLVYLLGLQPGNKITVAGAHEGKVIDLLNTVYPGCLIYGYEPLERYAQVAAARMYGRGQVIIVPRALSDKLEKLEITVDGVYSTAMLDRATNMERPFTTIYALDIAQIEATTLTDLLFLNVEGYEGRLLRRLHAEGVLQSGGIKRLVVQFHEAYDAFDDVMQDIAEAGYAKVYDDYPRWVYWKRRDA